MKFDGFVHHVEAELTLTGKELVDLFDTSKGHYDYRCRAMARKHQDPEPSPIPTSRSETDHWIYDQMCFFVSRNNIEDCPWGREPEVLRELCAAHPELTHEATVSWRVFDTICKVMEMDAYRPEPNHDLSWGIRQAFNKVRGESRRLQEAEKQRRAEESS